MRKDEIKKSVMSNNIHVEIQNASVILLPETELAGTVLSYTVKSFQANI